MGGFELGILGWEVPRMMKLQEVLLKVMAKKMRWRERLEVHGYDGLTDRKNGKQSQRRMPVDV